MVSQLDACGRQEFRRHKTAKPEFLVGFFREWEAYVQHLEQATPASVGRELSPEHVAGLSDEQRVRDSSSMSSTVVRSIRMYMRQSVNHSVYLSQRDWKTAKRYTLWFSLHLNISACLNSYALYWLYV